eukprot:GHVT01067814.1.p2 GENE.GHVT01067814.1~~GHVT01067814.1.p2  ORF type:complete len:103 (-),score=2.96 GHVT01067814.1:1171-1479(-)
MFVQDDCRLLECLARLPSLSNFGAQLLEDILEDMPKNISALQSDRHLRDNARRGVISAHLLARILSALHAVRRTFNALQIPLGDAVGVHCGSQGPRNLLGLM